MFQPAAALDEGVVRQNSVGVYRRDIRAKIRCAYSDPVEFIAARAYAASVTKQSCVRMRARGTDVHAGGPDGLALRRMPFVAVIRPPTSGMTMIGPVDVGETGRGAGASFLSPRWVRLR